MTQQKITKEETKHTAALSRLYLTDQEEEKFTEQLDSVLDFFKDLSRADTNDAETVNHYEPGENKTTSFREDEIIEIPTDEKEAIRDNFPARDGNYLRVKTTLQN